MFEKLLSRLGVGASTEHVASATHAPYGNPAVDRIYDMLFCDEPGLFAPADGATSAPSQATLCGHGLDTLAAYGDGGVRYINQTGRLSIFEGGVGAVAPAARALLDAARAVVARIGPWDKPRRPPPRSGNVRLSFVVSDGLYFGEGPMAVMEREPLAGAVIERAGAAAARRGDGTKMSLRPLARARKALALAAFLAATTLGAASLAPNAVEVTPGIVTSGQPSRETLAKLREQGFGAVIYLAPSTVHDAVLDEPVILNRQSIAFVNIPIDFERPTAADYEAFALQMKKFADRKVLVHCQINLRASAMVFLYRVIALKEDPHKTYADVSRVWVPNPTWKRYLQDMLAKRGIAFEPY